MISINHVRLDDAINIYSPEFKIGTHSSGEALKFIWPYIEKVGLKFYDITQGQFIDRESKLGGK